MSSNKVYVDRGMLKGRILWGFVCEGSTMFLFPMIYSCLPVNNKLRYILVSRNWLHPAHVSFSKIIYVENNTKNKLKKV